MGNPTTTTEQPESSDLVTAHATVIEQLVAAKRLDARYLEAVAKLLPASEVRQERCERSASRFLP